MVKYEEWEQGVPHSIRKDLLWRVEAYRLGLFLAELAWHDTVKIQALRRYSLADQLYRAAGSVSANLAEGYSRGTGKDRSKFYEYSLGSARETRDWYYKARHALGETVVNHRIELTSSLIRLTLSMIKTERAKLPFTQSTTPK